tara:strand:- start:207 stop:647 length:441 start_codon:yes stop_codon:yes gene_type:complete
MRISKTKLRSIIQSVISETHGHHMSHDSHDIDLSDCRNILECCKKMLTQCPELGIKEIAQCIYDKYCQGVCKPEEIIGCINECLICIKEDRDAELCCDCVEVMVCVLDVDRCGGTQMTQSAMHHKREASPHSEDMHDNRFLEKDYC